MNVRIHDAFNKISIVEGARPGSLKGTAHLRKCGRNEEHKFERHVSPRYSGGIKIRDAGILSCEIKREKEKEKNREGRWRERRSVGG